jgi:drug/metabolite transporter (DMT)-like permease
VSRYWPLLLLLASAWGASYLFIKVAVEGGFKPAPLMCARAAIAALLTSGNPAGSWWAVAGTLAVVLASLAYASGSVFGQRSVTAAPGPVLATGAMLTAATALLPFAILQFPAHTPDGDALLSLLGLALLGTALAQLVLYRMLQLFGARSVSLVTYLTPVFALVYGALLLDEPVTAAALAGLALILAGVALGSGAVRSRNARVARVAAG